MNSLFKSLKRPDLLTFCVTTELDTAVTKTLQYCQRLKHWRSSSTEILNYLFCLIITLWLSSKVSQLWENGISCCSRGKAWRKPGELESLVPQRSWCKSSLLLSISLSYWSQKNILVRWTILWPMTMNQQRTSVQATCLPWTFFFCSTQLRDCDITRCYTGSLMQWLQIGLLRRLVLVELNLFFFFFLKDIYSSFSILQHCVCVTNKYGRKNSIWFLKLGQKRLG